MSDKITFTLDGKTVEAEAGMTIWEVANGRGLTIPHLCHKPAPGVSARWKLPCLYGRGGRRTYSGRLLHPRTL